MYKLFILFFAFGVVITANPIVQTAKGKVQGVLKTTFNNNSYYAFMGIPYAKPPIGRLRFQPPQSADPWDGVFDDRGINRKCIQDNSYFVPGESEDCLYLHVYTPQLPSENTNGTLPVIAFIHGGAFLIGSSIFDEVGPQYMMDYGVVFVALSYRLGALGFLSTGDLTCPGNNGFKDQQLALRWIQENIREFGGDAKRVTIFGQSAGAASVGYHLLSPSSKGLFRGAIQDSGTALGTWTMQIDPRGMAFLLGENISSSINEKNTTSKELLNFLSSASVSDIKRSVASVFGDGIGSSFFNVLRGFLFAGVMEPSHEGAFLTESPYQKLDSGNFNVIPTLMGINSEETLFLYSDENFKTEMEDYDEHLENLVPVDMHLKNLTLMKSIGQELRKLYVNDSTLHENLGFSIKFLSDTFFARPCLKQAQFEARHTDVFFYEFAFLGQHDTKIDIPGAGKVEHGAELKYLLHKKQDLSPNYLSEAEIITMRRMLTMWTNFAKYLNPTPEPLDILQNITWPNINANPSMPYLLINNTVEVKYDLKKAIVEEYQRLYDLYAIHPLITY